MLRAATLGGAIALALLVASCSSEGSPPSYTALYLEPYDLSTGADRTGVDHPQLVINGRSWEELQFGDAEFLTNALSISTLPEGRAVEIVAEAVNHGSGGIGIDITPRVPFEERWYAVRLHLGDRASHYTVLPALAPGASPVDTVNRFYNGSLPLLRVYSGGEDAGVIRVGVGATEALQLPDGVAIEDLVTISSGGAAARCALDPLSAEVAGARFEFLCTGASPSRPLTVVVRPGFTSVSGVPLRDLEGRTEATVTWTPARERAPTELSAAILGMHGAGVTP